MNSLLPTVTATLSSQGYGNPSDIPTLYGLMWIHPNMLGTRPTTLKEGFQTMWERLIATTSTLVRLNVKIARIARHASSVDVTFASGATETFDWLVMAVPMPRALDMLASPTVEELALFSKFNYRTARIDVGHLSSGAFPGGRPFYSQGGVFSRQTDYYTATRTASAGPGTDAIDRAAWNVDGNEKFLTMQNLPLTR